MELTQDKLCKLIQRHLAKAARYQTLENYYKGKHKIKDKILSDATKPCNKVTVNYPKYVVDNFAAYEVANPVTYKNKNDTNLDALQDILAENNSMATDTILAKHLNTYGKAFELFWIDENSQVRFKAINPKDIFTIRTDDLEDEIEYAVRLYQTDNMDGSFNYWVELYDNKTISTYAASQYYNNLSLVDTQEHYFKDVPVVEYTDESAFEGIISLVDAYEKIVSGEVDSWESFCDCYLVLKGMDGTTADDIKQMKANRCMLVPQDGDATYLTKDATSQQIENLKKEIVDNIFAMSNCPNFADSSFGVQSGIALKHRLLAFINSNSGKICTLKRGIQRRLELIGNVLSLTADGIDYRSIDIVFTPNLPVDIDGVVAEVNSLRGLVSNKTLLSQLPFVSDVDAELAQVAEENKAANPFDGMTGGEADAENK